MVDESRAGSPVVPLPGGHLGSDTGGFLALFIAAFAAYLVALALVRRGAPFAYVFVLACAIQLAPLAGPTFLSSDAWTYWSYARVHDPYTNTPSDDRVAGALRRHGLPARPPRPTGPRSRSSPVLPD